MKKSEFEDIINNMLNSMGATIELIKRTEGLKSKCCCEVSGDIRLYSQTWIIGYNKFAVNKLIEKYNKKYNQSCTIEDFQRYSEYDFDLIGTEEVIKEVCGVKFVDINKLKSVQ